jgi:Cytochrome c7 and related cytochrome c
MKLPGMKLVGVVLACGLLMTLWGQESVPSEEKAAASAPEQPLPFSHKNHAGMLGLPCQTCHLQSRSGEAMSIPQAKTCMTCHQTIATEKPAIQKLTEYAKSGATIPWIRIYSLPSFVSFSHKTHMDHGNTCQECHGAVATRDRLFKETEPSMGWCVNCHTVKKANTACDTCHVQEL